MQKKIAYPLTKYIVGAAMLAILLCCAAAELKGWAHTGIPKEFRESVMLKLADDFAKGVNPYAASALEGPLPPVFNVYGFLNPLIASFVIRLSGISPGAACTAVTLLWKGLGLLLVWDLVRCRTGSRLIALWAVLLADSCFWRYVTVGGAFPDQLGLLGLLLVYWLLGRKHGGGQKYTPYLLAAVVTALFYTKLYFAVIAAGVAIYLLLADKKSCVRFLAGGFCMGFLSVAAVQAVFPLYFSECIYYMKSYVDTEMDFRYACMQLWELRKYYLIPFLLLAAWIGCSVWIGCTAWIGCSVWIGCSARRLMPGGKQSGKREARLSHEMIQLICMALFLFYFGMNRGTWLTYHLQLMIPPVILLCADILGRCRMRGNAGQCCAGMILLFLSVVQVMPLIWNTSLDQGEVAVWEELYGELDEYRKEGELLLSPPLSYYCVQNQIYTGHYGHSNAIIRSTAEKWEESAPDRLLFPYVGEIFRQNENYLRMTQARAARGEFICIGIVEGSFGLNEDELKQAYLPPEVKTVYAGSHEWEIKLYRRRDRQKNDNYENRGRLCQPAE